MSLLQEAVKLKRRQHSERRTSVIEAMRPVKAALAGYPGMLFSDLGIKTRRGQCANRVCFDTGDRTAVVSVDSEYPGAILVLYGKEQRSFDKLEDALMHIAELIVEGRQ